MKKHPTPVCAAVDVGSNSFRLLIGTCNGTISIIKKELVTVALAAGMHKSTLISDEAISRASQAFQLFASHIKKSNVSKVRVCGTEALRRAANASILKSRCSSILGSHLEIIDGTQEAYLTQKGVYHGIQSFQPFNTLIIDVGGASTECIFSDLDTYPPQSFPIGALSITQEYFSRYPADDLQLKKAAHHIKKVMMTSINQFTTFSPEIIASGGTATALCALHLGLQEYDPLQVHGTNISKPSLISLCNYLARLSSQERVLLPGLDEGRGEIILGGSQIYSVLVDLLNANQLKVSDYGLLEGIFLSLVSD